MTEIWFMNKRDDFSRRPWKAAVTTTSHSKVTSLMKEVGIRVCNNPPEEKLDQSHFSGQLQLKVLALSAVVTPASEKAKTAVQLKEQDLRAHLQQAGEPRDHTRARAHHLPFEPGAAKQLQQGIAFGLRRAACDSHPPCDTWTGLRPPRDSCVTAWH